MTPEILQAAVEAGALVFLGIAHLRGLAEVREALRELTRVMVERK